MHLEFLTHGKVSFSAACLGRMGAKQLELLPVVNRANVHKLEGIITLQDILDAYRLPSPKSDEE